MSATAGIIAASPETGPRMSNAVARSLGLAPPKDLPGARARTLGTLGMLTHSQVVPCTLTTYLGALGMLTHGQTILLVFSRLK